MAQLNRFQFIGNLTKDPEFRVQAGTNKPLCLLDVAVNATRLDPASGEAVPHTDYFNKLHVWGRQADACYKFLGQGSLVLIEGSLTTEEYAAKYPRPGEQKPRKYKSIVLRVDDVQFLKVVPFGGVPPEAKNQTSETTAQT